VCSKKPGIRSEVSIPSVRQPEQLVWYFPHGAKHF